MAISPSDGQDNKAKHEDATTSAAKVSYVASIVGEHGDGAARLATMTRRIPLSMSLFGDGGGMAAVTPTSTASLGDFCDGTADGVANYGLSQFGGAAELNPIAEGGHEAEHPDVSAAASPECKDKKQEEENNEEEQEEADTVRVRRAPRAPTQREREEHEATHIPYRDWCPHCVRGRGVNGPHRRGDPRSEEEKAMEVPRVSLDYFFMAQGGDRATQYPMIVMIDEGTDYRYMRAVGRKGLGEGTEMEWLIKDMAEELKSWGHIGGRDGELILKSDGEPSIKAVRDALGRYHGGKIIPEQPPPGESQSNGKVEEAGKTIRGYIRVFKDAMERRSGETIGTGDIILQWLVRWAAMLYSRFRRGADGKTAYQRMKGKHCKQEVVPFGESIYYKRLNEDNRDKMASPWDDRVWLGHSRSSNEAIVGTKEGVVRAWAIRRKPEGERWNAQAWREMKGTPARPNPNVSGAEVPTHVHIDMPGPRVPDPPPARRAEEGGRRAYLKPRDFEQFGFSDNCEGCRRIRAGNMAARPHSAECRRRMEAALAAEDNPRWRRAQAAGHECKKAQENQDEAMNGSNGVQGEEVEEEMRGDEDNAQANGGRSSADNGGDEGMAAQAEGSVEGDGIGDNGMDTQDDRKRDGEEDDRDGAKRPRIGLCAHRQSDGEAIKVQALKYGISERDVVCFDTGWDFRNEGDRREARRIIQSEKPKFLVGSPVLKSMSPLQRLNTWTLASIRDKRKDEAQLKTIAELMGEQHQAGGIFLLYITSASIAWTSAAVRELINTSGVRVGKSDRCMFGLTTGGKMARGRLRYITNSYHMAKEIQRDCSGEHQHRPIRNTVHKQQGDKPQHSEALIRAIGRGIYKEAQCARNHVKAIAEVSASQAGLKAPDPSEFHETIPQLALKRLGEDGAWDDVTGLPLDRKGVQAARAEEVQYIRDKKVWVKIPRAEAQRRGMKVIKARWIDINKGDDKHPKYRSRYVAKEFNDGEVQGLFAGTPPLEALRYILHQAATIGDKPKAIMINDVARAFFEAKAERQVCVELPEEDKSEGDKQRDAVGHLVMSLYGTRDAAKNWQEEVASQMQKWGFMRGKYNPCLYYHPTWNVTTLVHGDDFVSTGDDEGLRLLRGRLEARFKVTTKLVGHKLEGEMTFEASVLNRVVRATEDGWEYEADQRHIDLLISGMGLEGAKAVTAPGEDEKQWEEEENAVELNPAEARVFRSHAARINYLAQDRPDLQYCAKEVCRAMATPTRGAWKKLKRIVRYLLMARRVVTQYKWQGREEEIATYSDSDWAGCRRSGKSTSGGAIMVGEHYIKSWASTQASVTLSSAEAETVAVTKAMAETIGVLNMARDLGVSTTGVVYTDSSAAAAIADRRGAGKLRHINIRMLWIQEREARQEIELRKVKGAINPADLMTKYLTATRMADLGRMLGQVKRGGKSDIALELQGQGLKQVSYSGDITCADLLSMSTTSIARTV